MFSVAYNFAGTLRVNAIATDSKGDPVQQRQSTRYYQRLFVVDLLYITTEDTIKQCGHKACPNSPNSVLSREFVEQGTVGRPFRQQSSFTAEGGNSVQITNSDPRTLPGLRRILSYFDSGFRQALLTDLLQ